MRNADIFFFRPGNDNIVPFRDRSGPTRHPPLINLPVVTKYLIALIAAAFILLQAVEFLVPAFQADIFYSDFGFVSAKLSGDLDFTPQALLSLATVNFLHANWMHLIINCVTLAAFGAGIEKRMGGRSMLLIFFLGSALACLCHFLASPHSQEPVIGASGGISALFGAALVMLKHDNQLQGQRILPMVVLWVLISVGFGLMGGPGGERIAWVAHVGGFIAGLAMAWLLLNKVRRA